MAGICADRAGGDWLAGHGLLLWWAIAAICLALYVVLARRLSAFRQAALLLVSVTSIAGSWHHLVWNYYELNHVARFCDVVPQPVCLRATALERLKWRPPPPRTAAGVARGAAQRSDRSHRSTS